MSDIDDKYILLGKKIKERRKELGMTMTELASETNLSQSAISMIENGLRQPTLQTIGRVSQVLQYDFSQILIMDQAAPATHVGKSVDRELSLQVLQFELSLGLTSIKPSLPDEELQQLITAAILEKAQHILQEESVKQRLEQHVSAVIKEDIERKRRELEQRITIYEDLQSNS